MVISLIGYRGSGKSTVAPVLAARLGWEWADADAVIEARAGRTIREIFAAEGEPRFRELERLVMADLLNGDQFIVAAGGGAVLAEGNRARMQAAGPVIWLRATVEELAARINADATTAARRPHLTGHGGGTSEIAQLLAVREPLDRACATLTVDTGRLSAAEIVERIIAHVHTYPQRGA